MGRNGGAYEWLLLYHPAMQLVLAQHICDLP
jgi:hypothetical protein